MEGLLSQHALFKNVEILLEDIVQKFTFIFQIKTPQGVLNK